MCVVIQSNPKNYNFFCVLIDPINGFHFCTDNIQELGWNDDTIFDR
jgi:hypothetical protein